MPADPIACRGKEMPGAVERLQVQLPVARERWTAALRLEFVFRQSNDPLRPCDSPVFLQQFGPVPGA